MQRDHGIMIDNPGLHSTHGPKQCCALPALARFTSAQPLHGYLQNLRETQSRDMSQPCTKRAEGTPPVRGCWHRWSEHLDPHADVSNDQQHPLVQPKVLSAKLPHHVISHGPRTEAICYLRQEGHALGPVQEACMSGDIRGPVTSDKSGGIAEHSKVTQEIQGAETYDFCCGSTCTATCFL